METAQRQPNPALVEELLADPSAFEFFRAVEILEDHVCRSGGRPVGADRGGSAAGHPGGGAEPEVRFRVEPTLGFAAAPIAHIAHERNAYCLAVSFIGLVGSSGTLPVHYTETLLQRLHQKDYALQTFLDALQDRTTALFYRAWKKHRPTVALSATDRAKGQADPILEMFLGLVGRLPRARGEAIGNAEWAEVHHVGHFSDRRRSARGLKVMLEGLLRCSVSVEQFVGQWIELDDDACGRLGDRAGLGEPARLGQETVLGTRVWSVDSKVRITCGPLDRNRFRRLWPGGDQVQYLRSVIRAYIGPLLDYDLEWQLEPCAPAVLQLGGDQRLGRDCWLGWSEEGQAETRVHSPLWPERRLELAS